MQIEIGPNSRQSVPYYALDLPMQTALMRLSEFDRNLSTAHWHPEWEFITVQEGCMVYTVNGTDYLLNPDEGIIVNAGQLHCITQVEGTDCVYLGTVVHPSLFCEESVLRSYYCNNIKFDAFHLTETVAWQKELLRDISRTCQLHIDKPQYHDLRLRGSLSLLLATICEHCGGTVKPINNRKTDCLKQMLGFIEDNYREPLTVRQIAASGAISESACFQIFQEFLHQTPMAYLMQFRVKSSLAMLESGCTVTEAATASGFTGASYYAEVFRKVYNISPSIYKREWIGYAKLNRNEKIMPR